jgi:hypothetical protein
LGAVGLSAASGCGSDDNSPPSFESIAPDHQVAVGSELRIVLRASDPDGDTVSFDYQVDLGDISDRAGIEKGAPGVATFKWTPIASDVGIHALDLIASDGKDSAKKTVSVDVKSAVGSATSPVFRQPLGTGTTLDLAAGKTCVSVPIEIEDPDSPGVTIGEEEPKIEGATLTQDGGLTGKWEWCPTASQIEGGELFQLTLSADDGDNPKIVKDYVIVLKKGQKQNCPGEAPSVTHTPQDANTIVDLTIDAAVGDDTGLKYAPLLLYSTTDPGPNPDLAAMTQVNMIQIDGDLVNGTWAADVPNPVANQPQGSSATLYYLIIARDNDDEAGDCDHITQSPASGAYSMQVTNPGGAGGLGVCESCTADVQCGDADDHCIYIGAGSNTFCGQGCTSSSQCPSGYTCSSSPVLSVDFASAKQCVPQSQTCGSTTQCVDDQYEDNDTLTIAKGKSALPTGTHNLKSCPGPVFDDEDWYKIDITSNQQVTASISGGSASDLDLFLKDSTGKVLASSAKSGSNESLTTASCLSPGTYYLHVYAWSQAENPYTLTWSKQSCSVSCQDDSYEEDDNQAEARPVNLNSGPYTAVSNQICAYDDDWYEMQMYAGESIVATVDFIQTSFDEEVDVYVYNSAGVNLTPCCNPNNGQSSDSDEELTYPITQSGTYYVVVKGWAGSENSYGICIDYDTASHPAGCN